MRLSDSSKQLVEEVAALRKAVEDKQKAADQA
jgi:hypothetical protein